VGDFVETNVTQPFNQIAAPAFQDVQQQVAPVIAGAQQAGTDALRQIEMNKLMGVGANQ